MADEPVFLFLASHGDEADAWLDYEAVKDLHALNVIGTYNDAAITKDADGKVKVHKHEKATRHGAWTGIAVGAVVGILFPPALVVEAAVGVVGVMGQAASRVMERDG